MSAQQRTLTITLQPDWRAALRQAGQRAQAEAYASRSNCVTRI